MLHVQEEALLPSPVASALSGTSRYERQPLWRSWGAAALAGSHQQEAH